MSVNVKAQGAGLKGLKKALEGYLSAPNPGVKVGVLEGATYSGGPLDGEPVAQNLARHEFGTSTIPARAPFRTTWDQKIQEWAKEVAQCLAQYRGDVRAALTQAGDAMAMDIQQAFDDGLKPELKEATVIRKRRMGYGAHADKPVVLTGQSLQAIKAEYADDIRPFLKEGG